MAVTYYSEYKNKKLCEVVLLGSHDAGIAKGNSNTQTQTKGIGDQALKGARFFDLRIAAFANSGHGAGTHQTKQLPQEQYATKLGNS